ncbi:MAG: error-prone DNA polymerase, partial [Betaproteobacteria bacterium]|nr:error-prone DNA polymerase [Betaproteobacteria bacterium]
NAEAQLRSRLVLAQRYPSDWLAASLDIAAQCLFSLDSLRYEYPREIVPEGHSPSTYLRFLCEAGMLERYPMGTPSSVRKQIEHELSLIEELQYEAYFLTVADIVQFARERGILCQGRGSAANSAVCYVLGVTEVDPARMSVLFERFISRERREPPDIDIDFEHQRREEVIQYLYHKYGRERAALTAAVISWRLRSALREVGKALGFGAADVAQCLRAHRGLHRDAPQAIAFQEAGLDIGHFKVQQWIELSSALIGFPRHLSQHSGGFVIARDRLDAMVPIEPASMPGRSVIQWDKDDLDALGLLKVDILALGMLSAIRRALALISERDGRRFGMQDVPAEDAQTYAMISAGDSLGVFQIESRAQMAMLPKLKPRCFYDLVIEVAIIRPGP